MKFQTRFPFLDSKCFTKWVTSPIPNYRIFTDQVLVAHSLEEVAAADVSRPHVECPACRAKSQPEELLSDPRVGPPQMCQREEAALPAHEEAFDGSEHFQII